jgi:hypothetical protein
VRVGVGGGELGERARGAGGGVAKAEKREYIDHIEVRVGVGVRGHKPVQPPMGIGVGVRNGCVCLWGGGPKAEKQEYIDHIEVSLLTQELQFFGGGGRGAPARPIPKVLGMRACGLV